MSSLIFNVFFNINHLCNKGVPKLMNKTQHKRHLREPKDIIAIIGVKKTVRTQNFHQSCTIAVRHNYRGKMGVELSDY